MGVLDIYQKYEVLFLQLERIINQSQNKVLSGDDNFLIENINFFIKSYLVNLCSYTEALLQELAYFKAEVLYEKLKKSEIPLNFLMWYLVPNFKDKDLKFEHGIFRPTKKEINEKLSVNPYKTLKLFQLLGVQLDKCEIFQDKKEYINSIVTKRNNIIHHNDSANDVSFGDLLEYLNAFKQYLKGISEYLSIN